MSKSLFDKFRDDLEKYIAENYVESFEDEGDVEILEDGEDAGICGLPEEEIELGFRSFSAPMECMAYASRSLDDVVGNLEKSFMEMVFTFADSKGMTDTEVQKKANIDRKAFSKLRCGTTKNPSKSTALAFAVALELNLDDTKDLLSRAGFALSPCSKMDLIVQYFIERNVYDIDAINIALYEHGEQTLGSLNK